MVAEPGGAPDPGASRGGKKAEAVAEAELVAEVRGQRPWHWPVWL